MSETAQVRSRPTAQASSEARNKGAHRKHLRLTRDAQPHPSTEMGPWDVLCGVDILVQLSFGLRERALDHIKTAFRTEAALPNFPGDEWGPRHAPPDLGLTSCWR